MQHLRHKESVLVIGQNDVLKPFNAALYAAD